MIYRYTFASLSEKDFARTLSSPMRKESVLNELKIKCGSICCLSISISRAFCLFAKFAISVSFLVTIFFCLIYFTKKIMQSWKGTQIALTVAVLAGDIGGRT